MVIAAASVLAGAAFAAEKPLYRPIPDWVKAVEPAPAPASSGEAAIDVLLVDQQYFLEPGQQQAFTASAIKIKTPQGLAAGNISLPWRPETDELNIHKLQIRRNDEIIDVLASGQTFTVMRREANLEIAMLDGVLTANIQPEGLQVGDVIEIATSVSSTDPVLRGHLELAVGGWAGLPIGRQRLRVEWPASLPMKIGRNAAMPLPRLRRSGDRSYFDLVRDNIAPYASPKGAPTRYHIGPMLEMTDFSSWAELGALLAPLYEAAAAVPAQGALRSELERIMKASADPKVRAQAALALVQDKVRYVALMMGEGGLIPASAETTWARRYGDCKAKTALLISLLDEMGIEAEPVVVSSTFGDGLDARLPMIGLFDHVLVRAMIDGRTYWLDGTRTGDAVFDEIQTPAYGWGVPLIAKGAALVRMMPPPMETPIAVTNVEIDARAGLSLPAPAKVETILRGDAAVAANLALANLAGEARDRALRDYWRNEFDFIELKSTTAKFDAEKGEYRVSMEGDARMDWSGGRYRPKGFGVGYKANFERGVSEDRDAPYAVLYPYYNKRTETVLLPAGFPDDQSIDETDVDETAGGVEYRRRATLAAGVYRIEKTERSVAPEFPAKDAGAAQAALRALADQNVSLVIPYAFVPTEQELSKRMTTTPTTADGFNDRGRILMDHRRFDEAIADFDRAIELDPANDSALAHRGLSWAWKGEPDRAEVDFASASAINARNVVVFNGRGLIAQTRGDNRAAVTAFTMALDIEPNNAFAMGQRAQAHRALGEQDAAVKDATAALKLDPFWTDLYLLKANILRRRGESDAAIAEAAAVTKANPNDFYAFIVAGNIYAALAKEADAMAAFDRALAIKQDPLVYLNRAFARPKSDVAGRRADLEEALKLDPKSDAALGAKAAMQAEAGDLRGAISTLETALDHAPENPSHLVERGVLYVRIGDDKRAEKDFANARKFATTSHSLNELCWKKATAGVALASALADCEAALGKAADDAAILDSRGFVYLRLERYKDAITDYDRALAIRADQAASLYGRAVAWARLGEKAKSDADMAAALQANPDVKDEFEGYGLKP